MKKIFTLFAAIATAFSAMATTFTFETDADLTQTVDGITVTIAQGSSNNPPKAYDNGLRLYASNTITISGSNLSNISLSFTKQGSKAYATLSASTGSLVSGGESTADTNVVTDKWTGSASSVTFTLGDSGQRLIKQIVVNGDGSETDPSTPVDPSEPDTPGSLDPDYSYAEPTTISAPDLTVQGDAYSFIDNNIEVSCTKGAVNETYFSAHAGFDMTFTASKPIKGIVVNGFVKKGFEATASKGEISYLSPAEDTDANPVVVITDINSTSVTVSCVKQLRCYTVEFYFDANPEATVSGGNSGSGSTNDLTFDSAEAVYESEYSEIIGEYNYSIFLFNASAPELPYLALDIYPADKDDITGTYSINDWSLGDYTYYIWGEGDYDMAWAMDGEATITKSGDEYTIKGWILGDNDVTYNFSFSGTMPFYTDDEYYGDGGEGDDSVDTIINDAENVTFDPEQAAYDLRGRRVGNNYRGIVLQNGHKYLLK